MSLNCQKNEGKNSLNKFILNENFLVQDAIVSNEQLANANYSFLWKAQSECECNLI